MDKKGIVFLWIRLTDQFTSLEHAFMKVRSIDAVGHAGVAFFIRVNIFRRKAGERFLLRQINCIVVRPGCKDSGSGQDDHEQYQPRERRAVFG